MCGYLRGKFQVSSITLTSFRQGGNFTSRLQEYFSVSKEILKIKTNMEIRPYHNKLFFQCSNTLKLTNIHGLVKYFNCSAFLQTHFKVITVCGGEQVTKIFSSFWRGIKILLHYRKGSPKVFNVFSKYPLRHTSRYFMTAHKVL